MRSAREEFRNLVKTFDPKSREYWRHVGVTVLGFLPEEDVKAARGCLGVFLAGGKISIGFADRELVPLISSIWFARCLRPVIQDAKRDYELPEHAQHCIALNSIDLKDSHKLELGRREQFVRKAQAYLMGVTVGTSLAIGMLNIAARANMAANGPSVTSILLRVILGGVVLSLFMSAFAALRVIAPWEVYDLYLQERQTLPDEATEKKQLIKLILLNQAYNLIAARYLAASYVGMRNGVVLILLLLLWAIVAG